jgi:N-acyl-D-aspartate/D-glutamate deacylase
MPTVDLVIRGGERFDGSGGRVVAVGPPNEIDARAALREGLAWNWESFGEYLDAIDALPRDIGVAALARGRQAAPALLAAE